MVADAAEGLAYAESLRIVHCDIKPDNLMLDHHGTVKIADLGLAMTDEDNLTKLVGTPHFMPPEQVRREPMDHRSDLYALGCTFYRLLTGKTPCRGATVKDILSAQLKEASGTTPQAQPGRAGGGQRDRPEAAGEGSRGSLPVGEANCSRTSTTCSRRRPGRA